jgi:hypothetical protein
MQTTKRVKVLQAKLGAARVKGNKLAAAKAVMCLHLAISLSVPWPRLPLPWRRKY